MKNKIRRWGLWMIGLTAVIVTPVFATTLEDAIRQTLTDNPDVFINIDERKSRDEERKQAKAGYFPKADILLGYGRERSKNASTRTVGSSDYVSFTRREAELNVQQMLFDGFRTRSEVERTKARINAAAYTVYGSSEITALRATEVYLELLRREELLKLSLGNLDTHRRVHQQIQLRSQSGVGRGSDLDQVNGRLALAESNVIVEESNLLDARSNYQRVIGILPDGELQRPVDPNSALPVSIEEAEELALENNATLKSANADVESTMAQYEAAKASLYPRLDLEGGATWNDNLDGQSGSNQDQFIMLRLRYNLLNGGADVARKRQTAHLINEAKDVRDSTYRQVVESIRLSWVAYQATLGRLQFLVQHVTATEKAVEAYGEQFNIGERSLLDVLDSENELFEARRSYVDTSYDNLFAQFRILAGMSQLLLTMNIELPEEAQPLEDQEYQEYLDQDYRNQNQDDQNQKQDT